MGYGGWIKDKESGQPIPGATIEVYANGFLYTRVIANNSGYFDATGVNYADQLKISSAGYKTATFPADTNKWLYELEKNVKELPGVILPPAGGGGRKNYWAWILLGVVIIAANQKQ